MESPASLRGQRRYLNQFVNYLCVKMSGLANYPTLAPSYNIFSSDTFFHISSTFYSVKREGVKRHLLASWSFNYLFWKAVKLTLFSYCKGMTEGTRMDCLDTFFVYLKINNKHVTSRWVQELLKPRFYWFDLLVLCHL